MRDIYTGIDIGSDSIKIVVCEFFLGKYNVLASTSVRTAGVKKGMIIDPEMVSNSLKLAIKEIEPSLGVKIDKAIVTVPTNNRKLSIVSGTYDITDSINGVTGKDITEVLKSALYGKISEKEALITTIPISFCIDDKLTFIDPKGQKGEKMEVKAVIATAPKKHLLNLIKVFKTCNISIVDYCFASIGSYYEAKNKELDSLLGAVINIGSETIDVSIFNKGILIKNEIIELGSKNIDKDISYIYGINNSTSKTLKEKFAVCARRYADVNDVIEVETNDGSKININQYEISEVVESRVVELLKLAKKLTNDLTKRKIGYIIVTGGISELTGFSYVVENTLGITSTTMNMTTLGIRDNKYSSASGIIKFFHEKLELKNQKISFFTDEQLNNIMNNKKSIVKESNDTLVSKVFGYFTNN